MVDADSVNEFARAKIPSIYFLTVWLRKALTDLADLVGDDEELLTLAKGIYARRKGVLAVTDKRAIVVVASPRRLVESLPLSQVTAVHSNHGVFAGRVTIAAAGNEAVIRSIVPKTRADEISDVVRSHLIARLAKRHDSGMLSDAEFEDQKRKLLEG